MARDNDDSGIGVVSHQQHGIGKLINEINQEFTREYGDILIDTATGDLVNYVTTLDPTRPLYAAAMSAYVGSFPGNLPVAGMAASGTRTGEVTAEGQSLGNLDVSATYAVMVDPSTGNIWGGGDIGSITEYDRNGNALSSINFPVDVYHRCMAPDGTIFGSDAEQLEGDMYHIDRDGNLLNTFSGGTRLRGMTVDKENGNIWRTLFEGVREYDRAGNLISSFSVPYEARGITQSHATGYLHVSEGGTNTIHVYDRAGAQIKTYTGPQSSGVEFQGLAADPVDDSIFGTAYIYNAPQIHYTPHPSGDIYDLGNATYVSPR